MKERKQRCTVNNFNHQTEENGAKWEDTILGQALQDVKDRYKLTSVSDTDPYDLALLPLANYLATQNMKHWVQ